MPEAANPAGLPLPAAIVLVPAGLAWEFLRGLQVWGRIPRPGVFTGPVLIPAAVCCA